MIDAKWMDWVRALQAISQTGLHFTEGHYDRARYEEVGKIAAEILASRSTLSEEEIIELSRGEVGYTTPKVDVRGVVFREGKILLISEIADGGRWALPGGWADVNEAPSVAAVREIREESGFETRATKLLAVLDHHTQGQKTFPYTVYKLFFRCEITGGAPRANDEAAAIDFFGEDELPELSTARVTETQIRRFFVHLREPGLPADYD